MNELGVFYIATGVYKEFFEKFIDSLNNLFTDVFKHVIVISDGLTEYDHKKYENIIIHVEDFIDYPYPLINFNKFQIVYHYAQKYNLENIIYFDSETIIEKHESSIDDILIEQLNSNKLITTYSPYFNDKNNNMRMWMWGTDYYSPCGILGNYDDYYLINRSIAINDGVSWIQTSFFMCKIDVLKYFAERVKLLINYNLRVSNLKLNFSDEAFINYLYIYTDRDKFFVDCFLRFDTLPPSDKSFIYQKYYVPTLKTKIKRFNNIEVFLLYYNDYQKIKDINKFIIENINKFIISGYGSQVLDNYVLYDNNIYNIKMPLFNRFIENNNVYDILINHYTNLNLNISTYDMPDKDIYSPNYFIFINDINNNFNSVNIEIFLNENYDYIEGKSLHNIKDNNNFDFVIYSKNYILSYINNNTNYIPKVYKL